MSDGRESLAEALRGTNKRDHYTQSASWWEGYRWESAFVDLSDRSSKEIARLRRRVEDLEAKERWRPFSRR